MGKEHIPFGYRIKNGVMVVCEEEAGQIRATYEGYLSGLGYVAAAKKAGLDLCHTPVKRMLQNKHYLGDDLYPAIIDRQIYDAAEEERLRRSKALGRDKRRKKKIEHRTIPTLFVMGGCEKELEDPYERAAYLYSLIESIESEQDNGDS